MRKPTAEGCGHLHDGRAKRCDACHNALKVARALANHEARFWSKVDRDGPEPPNGAPIGQCWIWIASVDRNGYGQFSRVNPNSGKRTMAKAHRVAYEFEHGTQPDGAIFCHQCDNPPCVRPSHLVVADNQRNAEDRIRAGTTAKALTPTSVAEIKRKLRTGVAGRALARRFGVNEATISAIKTGRLWSHIE